MSSVPTKTPEFMKRGSWIKPIVVEEDEGAVSTRSSWRAVKGGCPGDDNDVRRSSTNSGGRVGRISISTRQELVMSQAELDRNIFNASLGYPLGSYEDATLALVGGKALSCWRLMRYGLPVPDAFVIPTYVYSMHIQKAGVVDLIDEVYSIDMADLRDNVSARELATKNLEEIRNGILSTPLNEGVVSNLESFICSLNNNGSGTSTEFAVRSSGSAEDLASQSFAGQYDTFLYQSNIEEICESIKKCWASMFRTYILDYALIHRNTDAETNNNAVPEKLKPPKMGVLVMKMINAASAGVCFSQNLWGAKNEVMIEAVFGQGEGLVGGEITPDRYVMDKNSTSLCYQSVEHKSHKFIRSKEEGGIAKVELPEEAGKQAVLDSSSLKAITTLARQVEEFYNRPQDIEWAIDARGSLYLLQARPITTMDNTNALSFLPPGEGFWTFDPTHMPRPLSPWMQDVYSMNYSRENGQRVGTLISTINIRFVHQFAFTQPVLTPPTPALERAATAYWAKKLYEDDYREFCDFFRPKCEALRHELQKVNPSSLSHRSLLEHVCRCYDLAAEFWKLHHVYTFPAQVVIGDYMNRMAELTGKDIMETLVLLEGASPESRGLLNQDDPILAEMYQLLRGSDEAMTLLKVDDSQAGWALDCLFHMPGRLGEVMREVRYIYGWRLTGGYDLVTASILETPEFFIKTLFLGTQENPMASAFAEERIRNLADEWKNEIPVEKHEEFEEILDIGRTFFRLRDERGLCTDLTGIGYCRRGILEAGRHLVQQGVIYEAQHLCVARKHEAIALLGGNTGGNDNVKGGLNGIPTARELERRHSYITNANPNLVPRALGTPPPPPPDHMQLPPGIRRTMGALSASLLRGMFGEAEQEEGITASLDTVKGLAASAGIAEGPCRLIINEGDLMKVKKGDIVVTYSCSASFNVVLALCAGIVTDYGGMLSHAAIVAREFGLPAVVGTQLATNKFKNGDMIRVDCTTSKVTLVVN